MEADLLRYYAIDVMDLWRGRLSYRRLALLIRHLPSESWTQTALRDANPHALVEPDGDEPSFGPWALEHYQLARLTDEIGALRYLLARTNGIDNYPEPTPTPRPGMHRRVRRQSAAAVAYLKKLRNRGE